MPTQVQVYKSGAWKPTINADSVSGMSVYKNGAWKPVLACYTRQGGQWKLVFNLGLPTPPVTLHGFNLPNNSAVQMTWSAPLAVDGGPAKDYFIERRQGTWSGGKFTQTPGTTPVKTGYLTNTLSYTWAGLAQDTTYQFQVFWRNATSTVSTGSNTIVASTGHAAFSEQNPDYPAITQYVLKPRRTGSWNNSGGWGAPYGDSGSVTQGAKSNNDAAHNSYGCIAYDNLYEQVQDKITASRYSTQAQKDAAGDKVARNTTVSRAAIRQVFRTSDGGAGGGIPVRLSKGVVDFSKDKQPDLGSTHLRFDAPAQGNSKGDDNGFLISDADGTVDTDNTFETWVQQWIRKEDPMYTALVCFTQDGTGNSSIGYNKFCNFRGEGDTSPNWRLVVNLKWNIQTITAVAPVWNKQD